MNACWLSTFVIFFFLNVARQTEVSELHALRRSNQDVSHRNISAAKGNQRLTQPEVDPVFGFLLPVHHVETLQVGHSFTDLQTVFY